MRHQFRFHKSDREKYGDGWFVLDEEEILRQPGKWLVAMERQLLREFGAGHSIAHLMLQWRLDTFASKLGLTWLAVSLAKDTCEFAEYEPLVGLIEWGEPEDDADPPDSTSSASTGESTTS